MEIPKAQWSWTSRLGLDFNSKQLCGSFSYKRHLLLVFPVRNPEFQGSYDIWISEDIKDIRGYFCMSLLGPFAKFLCITQVLILPRFPTVWPCSGSNLCGAFPSAQTLAMMLFTFFFPSWYTFPPRKPVSDLVSPKAMLLRGWVSTSSQMIL